jgi:ABC-2 type transport system permease protein
MKAFFAFFKKELLESKRSGKLIFLCILFFAFGVMNPAIAKLTPWLLEIMADELAGSGMTVTEVTVDALTSWTQFFKNIPMALIAFVLMYGGIFTKEYESGTLVLMLTKGLARYKVVLAKALLLFSLWTLGYFLCFGVTYGYNAYFWDNSIAKNLMPAVLNYWLFGLWIISLTVLFSVISKSSAGVLLGTGAAAIAAYLLSLLPKITPYSPASLMNSAGLLAGAESAGDYKKAVIITAVTCAVSLAVSIPLFGKKDI